MYTIQTYTYTVTCNTGDLDYREGIGGLMEVVNEHKKAKNDGNDPEERDARKLALAPGGDRSDPELVKIDAAAKEIEEREQSGHLSESYRSQGQTQGPFLRSSSGFGGAVGWRTDIKRAEALYVEKPAEVDAFLKKMSIKELPMDEKRMLLRQLARQLIRDEIIAIPPLAWQSSSAEKRNEDTELPEDQRIVNRFGFLFVACEFPPQFVPIFRG